MERIIHKNEGTNIEFKEFDGTGICIANSHANLKVAIAHMQEKGLRLIDYQEAFLKIDKHPKLKEELKDSWFYVSGICPAKSDYYNFNDNFADTGDLILGKAENIEKNVYVRKIANPYPLSVDVHNDSMARNFGRRYLLNAQHPPDRIAPVILGVVADESARPSKARISGTKKGISITGITASDVHEMCQKAETQLSKAEEYLGKDNLANVRAFIEVFRKKEQS
jgi:hypothetical protein